MIQRKSHRLTSIFKKDGIDLERLPLSIVISQNCYKLKLTARKINELPNRAKIEFSVKPEQANCRFELVVDYKLVADKWNKLVQKDLWNGEEKLLDIELDSCYINTVELFFNMREMLVPEDIEKSTNFRNFNILSSERSFFVNIEGLNSLGGRMFRELYERECQGEKSAVIQTLDTKELEELLKCCCAYGSTQLIHRKNFLKILEVAEKEKISGLLRLVESFIIDSDCIHPIRKLEYAAEYRMSRLADTILRSFSTQFARLDSLFEYLAQNNETLADVHLDVLTMLRIFDKHIIL